MITAAEARERTQNFEVKEDTREKTEVELRITKSVVLGAKDCSINFRISKDTKKWLESLGYKVKRKFDPIDKEEYTLVKW